MSAQCSVYCGPLCGTTEGSVRAASLAEICWDAAGATARRKLRCVWNNCLTCAGNIKRDDRDTAVPGCTWSSGGAKQTNKLTNSDFARTKQFLLNDQLKSSTLKTVWLFCGCFVVGCGWLWCSLCG